MSGPYKVAFGSDFLKSFSAVPRNQQQKVMSFVDKFQENPRSSAINYETISDFRDKKLRSIRIDLAWRGIILKPDDGNIYILLWVDHHDKAYRWARNKMFDIHPDTGALQVVDMTHVEAAPVAAELESSGLFVEYKDRQLRRLGLPEALLGLVRGVKDESGLEEIREALPLEAYEALFYLAAGDDYHQVVRDLETQTKTVDTDDYETALNHPDSKRRFATVTNDALLKRMLSAPLELWRVFLHPSQEQLARSRWNGPTRILGGAGTGKTVAAMHRAKFLAEEIFAGENDRILFTTYTRNLAEDISANLDNIILDPKARARVVVVNLDRWVSNYLRRNQYEKTIAYDSLRREPWIEAMSRASEELDVAKSFYREEWEQVIQAHEVSDLQAYLRVSRVGRGKRLSRAERKMAWRVFEAYRMGLKERDLAEPEDAMVDARGLLKHQGNVLPYRAVIVDEAQDMSPQAFQLIRAMVPQTEEHGGELFITGDAHQRIYRHKVVLSRCGINIRGRSRKLKINYRTTEENRRYAVSLLKGVEFDDLDGGSDAMGVSLSLMTGIRPEVAHFGSERDQWQALLKRVVQLRETEEMGRAGICIVARTNRELDYLEKSMEEAALPTYRIRTREAEDVREEGIRLATMHRVKGLEFNHMIIASVNHDLMPLGMALQTEDAGVRRERERQELALLYVAVTRARKTVYITSYGTPSRFLT